MPTDLGQTLVLAGIDPVDVLVVVAFATVLWLITSYREISRWLRLRELRDRQPGASDRIDPINPTTRRNSWIAGVLIGLPVSWYFFDGIPFALPPAIAATYVIARAYRSAARGRRQHRLDEQTIIFVRVLNQTMLAGESTFRALELASIAVAEPLRGEIQWLVSRVYTDGLIRAIDALTEQTDSDYLKHLLRILRAAEKESLTRSSTCGRLTRLYDTLSTIRILQQTIRAQIAQTRYGQYLVMVLVPALVVISSFLNPTIARVLFTEPLGKIILGLVALDEITVFLVTRKLLASVDFTF